MNTDSYLDHQEMTKPACNPQQVVFEYDVAS
jgi:hypothetical protein